MLVVGAIQNFIGLERVLDAFWGKTGTTPADFLNLTNITSNYVESVTWVLQVVLGDGFLVSALFFLRLAFMFIRDRRLIDVGSCMGDDGGQWYHLLFWLWGRFVRSH